MSCYPQKGNVVTIKSTMHLSKRKEVRSKTKPKVIMYYNSTKGGLNTMDQLVRGYSTKRMTRRWPMAIFYYMVDVSAPNALYGALLKSPSLFCIKLFFGPHLKYASPVWFPFFSVTNTTKLKRFYRAASRTITGCHSFSAIPFLLSEASLLPYESP